MNKRQPNNTFKLIRNLTFGHLKPNPLWHKTSYRLKFLLRSLIVFPKSLKWLNTLSAYPYLPIFLLKQTNLPCKLHRPYLSTQFTQQKSYVNLKTHYDFLSHYYNEAQLRHLFNPGSVLLANIVGKNDETYTIHLMSEDRFAREGELTLMINDATGETLTAIHFTLITYRGERALFIGGLQGAQGERAQSVIQQTTKACFGLFPKRLVLEALSYIAQIWKCKHIVAVGNKTHIYNNWRYKSKHKLVFSDYDTFWLSIGATVDASSHFVMPITLARKPIEEVASKKRSEYRRRYQLLDDMAQQIAQNISLADATLGQ